MYTNFETVSAVKREHFVTAHQMTWQLNLKEMQVPFLYCILETIVTAAGVTSLYAAFKLMFTRKKIVAYYVLRR